jgi:hypothetical protein
MKAYNAWDMQKAAAEFDAVAGKDARAASMLAGMYLTRFVGTQADRVPKYLHYLDLAAGMGDMQAKRDLGRVLVYGLTPADRGPYKDTARGIVLMKEACRGGVPASCLEVARVTAGDIDQGMSIDKPPAADLEEAKRWGKMWVETSVATLSGQPDWIALRNLSNYGGRNWAGLGDENRATYGALCDLGFGRQPTRPRSLLPQLSDEQFARAVSRANALMNQHMPERAKLDARTLAGRVAAALASLDETDAKRVDHLSRYLAHSALLAAGWEQRLKNSGWDASVRELTILYRPVVGEHMDTQARMYREKRLDTKTWLAAEAEKGLDPYTLSVLDAYYDSPQGKKALEFTRQVMGAGIDGSMLALKLQRDPKFADLGRSASERVAEYAKRNGILLERDSPLDDAAASRRGSFMRDVTSQLSDARSMETMLVANSSLRLTGEEYQRLSRFLSPSEMSQYTQQSAHVLPLLGRLRSLRADDPDIKAAREQFTKKIAVIAEKQ